MEKMNNINNQLRHGYEQLNNSNYNQAIDIADEILEKKYNIDALVLAGISLFNIKEYQRAQQYLRKAFNEKPNNEIISSYLLETYLYNEETDEALNCLEKIANKSEITLALEIKFLEIKGEYNKIIKTTQFLKGIKQYELLAWYSELTNNLKDAKTNAKQGIRHDVTNFKCNIVMAKLYLRKNKIKKAKICLKRIKKKETNKTNLSIYYSIKAQCLEKQKKYNRAFKTYTKSNQAIQKTSAYTKLQGHSYYTFAKIRIIEDYFKNKPNFKTMLVSETPITFMVGFPRSGTTLLENILNSHTQISSIEEKPTIDPILQKFLQTVESIYQLTDLNASELKLLQDKYLQNRSRYCSDKSKIIIDKMPLNIIHIGILYRIFPNAKFIISTRDIRDVALSCYFQNFALNDAMAYFLDWNTTNKYLKQVMDLGLNLVNQYKIDSIEIRYEELVENPYQKVKEIIKLLDLEWQESIKGYRKKIIGKNINTPSYAKITEKINTKQKQRWKNYKGRFRELK